MNVHEYSDVYLEYCYCFVDNKYLTYIVAVMKIRRISMYHLNVGNYILTRLHQVHINIFADLNTYMIISSDRSFLIFIVMS